MANFRRPVSAPLRSFYLGKHHRSLSSRSLTTPGKLIIVHYPPTLEKRIAFLQVVYMPISRYPINEEMRKPCRSVCVRVSAALFCFCFFILTPTPGSPHWQRSAGLVIAWHAGPTQVCRERSGWRLSSVWERNPGTERGQVASRGTSQSG